MFSLAHCFNQWEFSIVLKLYYFKPYRHSGMVTLHAYLCKVWPINTLIDLTWSELTLSGVQWLCSIPFRWMRRGLCTCRGSDTQSSKSVKRRVSGSKWLLCMRIVYIAPDAGSRSLMSIKCSSFQLLVGLHPYWPVLVDVKGGVIFLMYWALSPVQNTYISKP
jgi:hypothetical protein